MTSRKWIQRVTDSLLPQTNQSLTEPQSLEPTRSYLNELVGEGKKYDSPEAVARAKIFGDDHIKRLETENKQLRDDVLRYREENIAKQKLEDLLDQIQGTKREPTIPEQQPIVRDESKIDLKQIESLIDNRFKQTELTRTYNQNLETVKNKLIERYGEDYLNAYKQQIDQLYLSKEEADDMARRKPQTFLKMLGLDQPKQTQQQFQPPPRNTNLPQNSQINPVPSKRTWSYYEDLRKKDRNAYLSQQTQLQMLQDRMEQGEAFNDAGFDANLGGVR